MKKKVAVVGAGYAGMAVAWHLLQRHFAVTLFDPLPIGKGTSGISAGLLHTYMGIDARLAWQGREAYQATLRLLEVASTVEPVFNQSGMLRMVLNERQYNSFRQCSQEHDDVSWLEPEAVAEMVPGITPKPAIFIRSAIAADGCRYLQGLWRACEQLGAQFEMRTITDLTELQEFDEVVVAAGASTPRLSQLSHLPIRSVKGQLLELRWPAGQPPLPCPVNSQVYCVMSADKKSCFIGGTYERGFTTTEPVLEIARDELIPRITQILPFLASAEVTSVRAGMRGSTPNRLPIAERIGEHLWILAGFGSKGLLYHSLLAEQLVQEVALPK